MELKQARREPRIHYASRKFRHQRTRRYLGTFLFAVLAFAFGVYVTKSGFFGATLRPFIKNDIIGLPRKVQATLFQPENEHVIIDIKHEDFMKLAYKREVALARGLLVTEDTDLVPATIRYGDESIRVRLRLKGDATDHLEGEKWSFRIKVRGDDALFGMKEFSIQHPQTRNYIYEWIFHRALKREEILAPRYEFINVTLNGKDLGVYALEEHFEKRLIEDNQRREGPIVRFNENLRWAEKFQQLFQFEDSVLNGSGSFQASDIDAFQSGNLVADPASYAQFVKAKNLLESFRRGELKTSEAFDVQKLAWHFAISDLMGAQHGNFWINVRFYYNPVTSRLEPIGYDGISGASLSVLSFRDTGANKKINEITFRDPIFFEEYVKVLEQVSEPAYLDELLAELGPELEQNLNVINSEFPRYRFSEKVLYDNQRYVKTVLEPVKGLQAYYHQATDQQLQLEIGNIQGMPVEVLGVSYQASELFEPVERIILAGKTVETEPVDYQVYEFSLPAEVSFTGEMVNELQVSYKVLGSSQIRQEGVFPWSYLDDDFVENDFIRQAANVEAFEFLETNEATKEIFIKPGRWEVGQNLIIPGGYRVIGGAGTELDLRDGAKILSYSALELIGTEEEPVVIGSTTGTGQGLVVLGAEEWSVLKYVKFTNLANPAENGWELTGAVTFYELPVELTHSRIERNRSEDGLNVIRSEFKLRKVLFVESQADAFDADFTTGLIRHSTFEGIGNDAIDISGSEIELIGVVINGAGDKGLSAGENSQLSGSQVEIRDAEIAVASKDVSEIRLEDISIVGGEIGLTAYQKKPEFGAAAIRVTKLEMSGVNIPYLVEEQSTVMVDDVVIEASRENVADILYGVEYGKSSN